MKKMRTIIIERNRKNGKKITLNEGESLTCIFTLTDHALQNESSFNFDLKGKKSSLNFLAFIIGMGKNDARINVNVRHLSPGSTSKITIKSVLFDRARVNFKGGVAIEANAAKSDSFMSHNTLLMTDHASARTIPALEIKNNDVKAGHAATIGKADPEELFYLQSRGINEQTAKDILVKAFFESLLATIIDPTIRQKISNQLNKCLIRKK